MYMLKKGSIFLLLFFCFFIQIGEFYGQNDSLNQLKYGWMRYRLRNYFEHMGTGPGESLPAGLIREYHVCKNLNKPSRIIDWGDGTIFHAWYLGVLGTEYKLLRNQKQLTDSTLRELYLAMEAFDRLDFYAEVVWSNFDGVTKRGFVNPVPWDSVHRTWLGPIKGSVNGFFLRNDAPPDFVKHFPFAVGIGSALSGVYDPRDTVYYGEYKVCPPFEYKAHTYYSMNEPSHDQIFPLLMGLILIHECSDEAMIYKGEHLGERARLTALRMINFYDQSWKYRNPVRTEFGHGCNDDGCMPYNGGGHSFAYSYPLAIIGNYLNTGQKFTKNGIKQLFRDWKNPYMTGKSIVSAPIWRNMPPLFFKHHVNHHMEVVISSISNTFAGVSQNRSPNFLWERVNDQDVGWEFYYLLNKFLFPNKTNYWPQDQIEYELNICPVNGPHWLFDKQKRPTLTAPWNISNRYVHGYKNGMQWNAKDSINPWFKGYFNGCDFMLLYNIYRLVYPEAYKSDYNLDEWMAPKIGPLKTTFVVVDRVFAAQLNIQNISKEKTLFIRIYNSENVEMFAGEMHDNLTIQADYPPGWYTILLSNPNDLSQEFERIPIISGDGLFSDRP